MKVNWKKWFKRLGKVVSSPAVISIASEIAKVTPTKIDDAAVALGASVAMVAATEPLPDEKPQ